MKKKEQALVISQEMLADGIFSMWIRTDAANAAKPGQFLSMYTDDGTKLLPRPISICEIDRDGEALRMVYRVTGPETGTEQFSRLQAGDKIEIVGPLGNGFPLEKAAGKRAMLMGGGIGVPPILELAKELAGELEPAQKMIVVGYRDSQTFLKEEFEQNGALYLSTEDGSVGTKGNVMDAVRENQLDADIICLRPDADAARDQGVCPGKWYRMLYFSGRADGLRDRRMPGLRLQEQRKGRAQQRA